MKGREIKIQVEEDKEKKNEEKEEKKKEEECKKEGRKKRSLVDEREREKNRLGVVEFVKSYKDEGQGNFCGWERRKEGRKEEETE